MGVSSSQPAIDEVYARFGALLIGVFCASIFYGMTCVQTIYYYSRYPMDRTGLKLLVAAVWIIDSIHQGLVCHSVYYYLILYHDAASPQNSLAWSILAEIFLGALLALLVQSFFVLRIRLVSGQHGGFAILVTILGFSILAQFGCSIAFGVASFRSGKTWQDVNAKHLKALCVAFNSLAAYCDISITGVLCFILHRAKSGISSTNKIIDRLTRYTVAAGALTAICACLSLFSILVWNEKLVYAGFVLNMGRLYANSLMASLNFARSPPGDSEPRSMKGVMVSIVVETATDYSRASPTLELLIGRDAVGHPVDG